MHRSLLLFTAAVLAIAPALLARPASAAKASVPAGQLISGSAGVTYSFRLPASLRLTTPARESGTNFAEYAASLDATKENGKRPFRFEVRITKFDKSVDCPAFAEFLAGLDSAYGGDQYTNHSPPATRKIAAATFAVRVYHKDVPADFNQKRAAFNVHHLATTQGDAVLSLVFFTDARDEAGALALQNEILNSFKFVSATGSGVCLSTPRKAASSAAKP